MIRDSVIEQQVLRSLRLDSAISAHEICVQSHRGVVTLSGTVPSYLERLAISYATVRAPGVCGLVNNIEVTGDSNQTTERSSSDNRSVQPANPSSAVYSTHDNSRLRRITHGKAKALAA